MTDARSTAMGGASVAVQSIQNPSSTAFMSGGAAFLAYENRYGMKELSTYGAAFSYSFKPIQVGVTFTRFGYDRYNENSIGIDLSKQLFRFLSAGVRINYLNHYRSKEEGSAQALSAELCATIRVSERYTIGLQANNLFTTLLTQNPIVVPLRLLLGCSYHATESLLLTIEAEHIVQQTTLLRGGMEYYALKEMALRIGFTTTPLQPTFGLGYQPSKQWSFDIASSYHAALGFTPTLSLNYCF